MRIYEIAKEYLEHRGITSRDSTVRGYQVDIKGFCLYMRNCPTAEVTVRDVIDWVNLQREMGWSQNALFRKSMAVKKFLEYCKLSGEKVFDPALVPVPEKEFKAPRVLDEKDYKKLLEQVPEDGSAWHVRNHLLFNLLWDTGARAGEILSLNVSDMDTCRRRALIRTEKAKKNRPIREIFWSNETNEVLKEWLEVRENFGNSTLYLDPEALFVAVSGQKRGGRLNQDALRGIFYHYCKKAGIKQINAHSFRHRMGLSLAKKGANNSVISNILGHSDMSSSYVYTYMQDNVLEEQYRKYVDLHSVGDYYEDNYAKTREKTTEHSYRREVPERVGI
jgi:site-specific recombinase XerD